MSSAPTDRSSLPRILRSASFVLTVQADVPTEQMRRLFPSQVKTLATRWRVGNATSIDDRDQWMVQGNTPGGLVLSLYFDQETGLLTRSVRYTDSPVGRIPTQIDYSDYRDVAGVKMPHKMLLSWVDGRDSFELTSITANANIDAARFNKPECKLTDGRVSNVR